MLLVHVVHGNQICTDPVHAFWAAVFSGCTLLKAPEGRENLPFKFLIRQWWNTNSVVFCRYRRPDSFICEALRLQAGQHPKEVVCPASGCYLVPPLKVLTATLPKSGKPPSINEARSEAAIISNRELIRRSVPAVWPTGFWVDCWGEYYQGTVRLKIHLIVVEVLCPFCAPLASEEQVAPTGPCCGGPGFW